MTNTTIAENQARAGLVVSSSITGTLWHVTIARNSNSGSASFANAIASAEGMTLTNCLIADQSHVFQYENLSCNYTHESGRGNFQWPEVNNNGTDELVCATDVTFLDPEIGELDDNGGPTPTILPAAAGVINAVTDCPATDQRGEPRSEPCTAGAVEPT
jgi:hypothetical protein